MDYIKAFVTGGLLCAAVRILMDKNETHAGADHGTFGGMWLDSRCDRLVRTVCQMGGFRGNSAASGGLGIRFGRVCGMELTRMGFWGCSPADSRRVRRGFRGVDLRLSVVVDLQTQDEEGLERED